jgi:hypothetical protein
LPTGEAADDSAKSAQDGRVAAVVVAMLRKLVAREKFGRLDDPKHPGVGRRGEEKE